MNVLFAFPTPLPVARYGGTERILTWHMKELARIGHAVTLIGHPNSYIPGVRLIPWQDDWRPLIPKQTQIIHLFTPPQFPLDYPVIVTIGGNGQPGEAFHPNTVFVSRKHAENHGSTSYIHNGIDLTEYPFVSKKPGWDRFLFLAKADWKVKNLEDCIRACRSQKKHLHIAGGRRWTWSRLIHSYGMVDQRKKLQLLRRTDALLFPVRWHEPFGIAIIEAMAMGLPVIASTYGSLPELIHDRTGVLCNTYAEFEAAIAGEHSFDPEYLRHYVEVRFSIQIISPQYVALYEKVLRGEPLNPVAPQTIEQPGLRSAIP